MMSYTKLDKILHERNISTYVLQFEWGIGATTVQRLKTNRPVSTTTLEKLCKHLNCKIEDIVEYVPDKKI